MPGRLSGRAGALLPLFIADGVVVKFLQPLKLLVQVFLYLAVGAVAVEVVHLRRVVPEVVELPGVDVVAVEMNEFVAAGTDSVVAADGVLSGVFVEMVVDGAAPGLSGRSVPCNQVGEVGVALNVVRYRYSGNLEEGGGVVNVLHEGIHLPVVAAGQMGQQRGAEGFLVHEAFVEPAVLAHVEALVGGVDDEGVLPQAGLDEVVQDAADVAVYGADDAQVVLHVAAVFPFGQGPAGEAVGLELFDDGVVVGVPGGFLLRGHAARDDGRPAIAVLAAWPAASLRAAVHGPSVVFQARIGVYLTLLVGHLQVVDQIHVAVNLHFLGGCGGTAGVVIVEVVRQRDVRIVKCPEVGGVGHPGAVRGLVVQQQAERFLRVASVLQPVEGQVGGDVGGVAGDDAALAVIYKGRVVVLALSDEDVPVVEAGGGGGQVPLADDGGLVAGLAQELGEGLLAAVEGAGVVGESVLVAVLAGEQAGPAGTADGVGHETLREDHARIGQAVDVRGLYEPVAIGADGLVRVVVTHDVDDVERLALVGPAASLSAGRAYCACHRQGQNGLYRPSVFRLLY